MRKSGFGGPMPVVQKNSRMAIIYFPFLLLVHTINSCNNSGASYLKKLTFCHNFLTTFLQASFEFTVLSLKFCSTHKLFIILFKVALYTWGSKIYLPTSQYGDLNILWNCFYWKTFLYIIIAQWSWALVLWTADPEFKSVSDFC